MNHLKIHIGGPYVCDHCGKLFEATAKTAATHRLKGHLKHCSSLRKAHSRPKIHICSANGCEEAFTSKKKQASHEAKCPLQVHQCDQCLEIFQNKSVLGKHRNSRCPKFVGPVYIMPTLGIQLGSQPPVHITIKQEGLYQVQ